MRPQLPVLDDLNQNENDAAHFSSKRVEFYILATQGAQRHAPRADLPIANYGGATFEDVRQRRMQIVVDLQSVKPSSSFYYGH